MADDLNSLINNGSQKDIMLKHAQEKINFNRDCIGTYNETIKHCVKIGLE